jgi:hypothetical protein
MLCSVGRAGFCTEDHSRIECDLSSSTLHIISYGDYAEFLAPTTDTLRTKSLALNQVRLFYQDGLFRKVLYNDVQTSEVMQMFLPDGSPNRGSLFEKLKPTIDGIKFWQVPASDASCSGLIFRRDSSDLYILGFWGASEDVIRSLGNSGATQTNLEFIERLLNHIEKSKFRWLNTGKPENGNRRHPDSETFDH